MGTKTRTRTTIGISTNIHEHVRIQAALSRTTIEKWVEDALIRKLEDSTNFNDQAAELRKLVNQ